MEGNGAAARQRPFAGPRSFRRLTATRASSPAVFAPLVAEDTVDQRMLEILATKAAWRALRERHGNRDESRVEEGTLLALALREGTLAVEC
jgi:hypothetical protein